MKKKVLSIILALTLTISLCACGGAKKAEQAKAKGQEIYDLLKASYATTDAFGTDIYNVWSYVAGNNKEVKADPLNQLVNHSQLSKDEVRLALMCGMAEIASKTDEDKAKVVEGFVAYTEEERAKLLADIKDETFPTIFMFVNNVPGFSVIVVRDAYQINGKVGEAKEQLEKAKTLIKELESESPDFKGLQPLKDIYVATSSYLDFDMNPEGSVLQAGDRMSGFRDTAKAGFAELELVF